MKNAKSNSSGKQRYVLCDMSQIDKQATITLNTASSASGSAETISVNLDGGTERFRRGRSLAKHIHALLNEHPHEWPKKRGKKSEDA